MRRRIAAFAAIAPLVIGISSAPIASESQVAGSTRGTESTGELFTCGKDAEIRQIPVRWPAVVLAGDGRLYSPCPTGEHKMIAGGLGDRELYEGQLIRTALGSRDPAIRWRAAQAFARLGLGAGVVHRTALVVPACDAEVQIFGTLEEPLRWQPSELFRLVRNADQRIKLEAAYGVAVALSRPGLDKNVATAALKELKACALDANGELRAVLYEAIGVTRYGSDVDRKAAAEFLIESSRSARLEESLGAVKGLEALIRQSTGWDVGEAARVRLREFVVLEPAGVSPANIDNAIRVRRLAMAALQAARDADLPTFERASMDRDWQVRRLVVMMLNLSDEGQARIGDRLANDSAFQVRYEYLSPLSRLVTRTRECAPLLKYVDDQEPLVAMRAMDLLSAQCTDVEKVVERMLADAELVAAGASHDQWHKPSRAMAALVRLRPAEAKKLMPAASSHPVWQVRAQAASSAVTMGMIEEAVTLAGDRVANVQTAAIDALARAKNSAVFRPAIEVLKTGSDHQVLRSAANAMNGVPADLLGEASQAMLSALRRLTERAEDTSRDPRVAILNALGRGTDPGRVGEITAFMTDFDDAVNDAAKRAYEALTRTKASPSSPKRRYPFQPPEASISTLPAGAVIHLETGVVELELRPAEAPVTVARFAAAVRAGYYNGLTFHRIVPNFVVQGGSPGASEYVGMSRFMRDEMSPAPHIRGAVGISTRGRDTGDGQIFIDLVDVPRLDRDYTVFAYVRSGMELVDRMLEGAKIKSISLK